MKKNTKGEVCKNLGIDFFVDDSISNVKNTHEAGITTFLFDTSLNKDFSDPDITWLCKTEHIKLTVFNPDSQEIVEWKEQWKKSKNTKK